MLVKLPFSVPYEIINECIKSCIGLQNNLFLNRPTDNFFYDPWKIKNEYKETCWDKILKTLPYDIGEARVIKLNPGETYMSHADIDDRWHLNLTGEQSYLIDLDNQKMYPLESDQYWYHMNAGKLHVASNFGSIDRFQIVVRNLLISSSKKNLIDISIIPSTTQYDYRYKFDKIISPFLNKINKSGDLKDFRFENETVTFKISKSKLKKLNDIITEDFKIIYA